MFADPSYGDKCKYSHEKNDGQCSGRGPPRAIRPGSTVAGTITIAVDGSFPAIDHVGNPHSDALIFPTNVKPSKSVMGIIRGMETSGRRLENAADVETLIWALAQSNAYNTGWVRSKLESMLIPDLRRTPDSPQ